MSKRKIRVHFLSLSLSHPRMMADQTLDPEQHKQRVKRLLGAIDYYRGVRLDADKQEKKLKKSLTELNKQFAGINEDEENDLPFDGQEEEEDEPAPQRVVVKAKQHKPPKKAKRLQDARKSAVRPKNQRSVRDFIVEEAEEEPMEEEEQEEEEEYEEEYDGVEEAEEAEEGEEECEEHVVEPPPAPKPKPSPPPSAPPAFQNRATPVLVKKSGKGIARQQSVFG